MAASIGILSGLLRKQDGLAVLAAPRAMLRPRPLELLESQSDFVSPGPFLLNGSNLMEHAAARKEFNRKLK